MRELSVSLTSAGHAVGRDEACSPDTVSSERADTPRLTKADKVPKRLAHKKVGIAVRREPQMER